MREKFENRKLNGPINVACKFDDGSVRYWTTTKELVVKQIIYTVNDYAKINERLTLRQLHYQFVSQNWIVNHDTAYKKLGSILDDCRYAGLIDWGAIEDRGRRPYIEYSVDDIPDALQDTIDQYKLNRQHGQSVYVELWSEKDALSGILSKSTNKYHIQLVINKGYTSSSAAYKAYERVVAAIENGQSVKILYFGDHDPSGLDMIRDIRERLLHFLSAGTKMQDENGLHTWWDEGHFNVHDVLAWIDNNTSVDSYKLYEKFNEGDEDATEDYIRYRRLMYIEDQNLFEVVPIGLTMEQIKKYKLPPNPTKMTDSRSSEYIKKFGKTCWEVDALKPDVLRRIVETNIEGVIDVDMYNAMVEQENKEVEELKVILNDYLKKK
jgi:hypothetical protein